MRAKDFLSETPIPHETDQEKVWTHTGAWNTEYKEPGVPWADTEYEAPAGPRPDYEDEQKAFLKTNKAKRVGGGIEAVVIKYDASHEVVKILGTNAKLSRCAHLQYLLACKKYASSNPYLPRIESIKTVNYDGTRLLYTIAMEELDEFNWIEDEEYNVILNKLFGEPDESETREVFKGSSFLPSNNDDASDVARAISKIIRSGNFKGVIDKQFIQAAQIIRAVADRVSPKRGIDNLIDVHSGNVMIRRTAVGPQLVITDPLYSGSTGIRDEYES